MTAGKKLKFYFFSVLETWKKIDNVYLGRIDCDRFFSGEPLIGCQEVQWRELFYRINLVSYRIYPFNARMQSQAPEET